MKKLISFIISAAMLSSGIAAYADNTENILKSIKSRIPDTSDYEDFSSSHYENDKNVFYRFEWSSQKDDSYRDMNITADDNGIITSMYKYDQKLYDYDIQPINRPTQDEALLKARELCSALNPSVADKYVITKFSETDNIRSNSFSFKLQRYENNIPVSGDTGNVQISLDCKEILSYEITYTSRAVFEPSDVLIDKANAEKAFNEKLGIGLLYNVKTDYKEKTMTPYLVYEVTDKSDKYINALNGEVTKAIKNNYDLYNSSKSMAVQEDAEAGGGSRNSFTAVEKQELDNIAGLKTKDELIEIIKSNDYIPYSDNLVNTSFNTQSDTIAKKYYAYFYFSSEDKKDFESLNVNIDMTTGEIKSFSYYKDGTYEAPADLQKAEAAAAAAAKALAGNKFEQYKLRESDNENGSTFIFDRYVNDIKVSNNTIRIALNSNYSVANFSINYTEIEFPSPDSVISSADASKKLFEYIPYSVLYINTSDNIYTPVYALEDSSVYIDAYSGNRLTAYGEEYTEEKVGSYTDIEGHWAEAEIKSLSRFGIGFSENVFLPDTEIKQKEFAALLNSIYGSTPIIGLKTDYTSLYRTMRSRGIISDSEISPEEPLTRETAAILLIRCMGAEKYAKLDSIYNCPFTDVTANKGYICILYGLGIISGSDTGSFYPNSTLTRAEAAIMIYNYLNSLS